MAVGSLDSENVNLVPGNLTMSQPVNMPIFRLNEWKFSCCHQVFRSVIENKVSDSNKKGLSMVVVMKRKLTSEMMTTYFPTILLTAITFATTFFKPFFFEAALSVNLTTMLVMTTIFISKMESLPPTADIRMIDVWLILAQLLPFIEVVLLTAMEFFRETEIIGKEKEMYKNQEKEMSRNERYIIGLKFVGEQSLFLIFYQMQKLQSCFTFGLTG